jgi:MscS family membrane protein
VWWPGIFWLGLPTRFLEVAVVAIKFATATAFVWLAYRVVDVVTAVLDLRARRSEGKFDDLLVPLVGTASKVVVVAFGLLFIADTLDLPIASVVAGLGIGGLAVALAAQDAVKNFFGSLMVIIDRPFSVGDAVKIGDVEGSVAELGFRSTRIRTFYNSLVTIPNGNLISATVANLGARQIRRWRTMLSLTYDTPPEKIERAMTVVREVLDEHAALWADMPPRIHFEDMAADNLTLVAYTWFHPPEYWAFKAAHDRINLQILHRFAQEGIGFAFPTSTTVLEPGSAPIAIALSGPTAAADTRA